MTAVPLDTLKFARELEEAMSGADLVTKEYPNLRLRDMEQRLTIKMGAMLAAAVALVAALVKPL
ncbi:MAG: hypothetical protein H7841_16700 [Magnetospirillum sp. WYHS-4]